MKVRRKKHDEVFSRLVRERANWFCEACGTPKMDNPQTLDCAHIMSRRSVALRWHPQNALALCRSCHMFYTEHPFDWSDFCKDKFGDELIAELRLVSSKPVKWTKNDREDIYKHLKGELKKMAQKRSEGERYRIEIEPHSLMHTFGL